MFVISAAILIAFLAYLFSSLFVWIGAKVIGVPLLSWERCATLGGFHLGAGIVLVGIARLWITLHTFTSGMALLGAMVGFSWFVLWITAHVFEITSWKSIGVLMVVAMLDRLTALVVQELIKFFSVG
ncbi:MAG: hypothetical protein GXP31_02835 [Kiritimatiellaeota bacterium]|nr:hypothetical protein [Kiritimatiellota bacterium]